ncbi:MAG: phosphatase PAP2 family protein [Sneathiella sp.]
MYQTDLNFYLQDFSTPWLDAFMIGVSWTGDQTFIVGLLCLVTLGIDLRRGFLLVQIFLVTIIATDILKTGFALPRPFFVDDTLNDFGALEDGVQALKDGAAISFFSWLPESSITAYRQLGVTVDDFGLPSGHTTGAVALWGGLAIVFRKHRLGLIAIIMIPLMMISRLYLARHFAADVLAGLGLGILVLLIAALLLNRMNWRRLFLTESYALEKGAEAWILFGFGFAAPLGLLFWGEGHVGRISAFLAVNMALLVLIWSGISFETGNIWQRGFRTVLGFGLFFAISSSLKWLPLTQGSLELTVIKGFVPVFVLFVSAPLVTALFVRNARQISLSE